MKTTSRFALAAAAGLFVGGIAFTPAKAADLGGDCCADLEERVAELEATTARKGNRKVSLTISGQVNRGLLAWDDGIDSDAYIVDNDYSSTRFSFSGKAKMKPGYTAGFAIEIEVQDAASNDVSQAGFERAVVNTDGETIATIGGDEGSSEASTLLTRQAYLYIEGDKYGRVGIGQQATASDGIAEINLANFGGKLNADSSFVQNFKVRSKGAGNNESIGAVDGGLRWRNLAGNLDGLSRNDVVRYDSPSIYGFIVSASWGDNDIWDAALRFKKEWNSFRIAAGIAYAYDGSRKDDGSGAITSSSGVVQFENTDFEQVSGSASVLHIPTGLFLTFAAGERTYDDDGAGTGTGAPLEDASYWYITGGIEKKFLSYGATTLYAEYGDYEGSFQISKGSLGTTGEAEASKFGIGVVQAFDSAALELYVHYEHWEADVGDADGGIETEDMDVVLTGARIKF
jgi:hypothetical protein